MPEAIQTMQEKEEPHTVWLQVKEHWIVSAGGALIILFALFIAVMGWKYPSSEENGWIFYGGLLLLLAAGIACCVGGSLRRLTVENMEMCYVNRRGKKSFFTLDDIGYGRLAGRGDNGSLLLYDLLGDKLCKLDFAMRGSGEFLQYLLDNQVRIQWGKSAGNRPLAEGVLGETAICPEEIGKCSGKFYDRVKALVREWEKQNQSLGACWEMGYGEFSAADLKAGGELWSCTRALPQELAELPEDYLCMLELYLKKDQEYVLDRRNEPVCFLLPYLERGASYQIGERLRLRKRNEEELLSWLEERLGALAKTLPRRRYHTEPLLVKHELRERAGIRVRMGS
ncbi:MAG: hypothetical protein LUI12_08435 [Clostridiales bacterium]|nr:hypothetical protein [Clostridiales bacterium]